MTASVASVTVAYNAVNVISRQIDALLQQSSELQEIIVVDNASTDGTGSMLAQRYPQITVLRMAENLGQAGGWAVGLSYAALKKRHDWVWTFDNDSIPTPETLRALLTGIKNIDDCDGAIGMVAPLPVHQATGTYYLPFHWRNGLVIASPDELRKPTWFADIVIASGSLIKRTVVEEIGLPRADFFIDVCDFEYCLRVRSHGYKIAVVSNATVEHEIGDTRRVRMLGSRLWTNHPPFREYYFSRNLVYLAWQLYPTTSAKLSIARHLTSRAIQVLLFGDRKISCLKRMIEGVKDGVSGRLGTRLIPTVNTSNTSFSI